jgi:adenine-specific DNA-methyltransferase
MSKKYTGSLTLDWYNKSKSIIIAPENKVENGIPAPKINWINKEDSLFYELDESAGRGLRPYWVNRNDPRVKESRPLVFQKEYKSIPKTKQDGLMEVSDGFEIKEITEDDGNWLPQNPSEGTLIRGDNLLALNTLKKHFEKLPDEEKIKCIYIDPPYNTGSAFENYDDNLAHSEWLTMMRDRLVILRDLLKEDGIIFVQCDDNEQAYLKVLMDEVFGRENFVADFIWNHRKSSQNDTDVSLSHNYTFTFAKNRNQFKLNPMGIDDSKFFNPDNDPRGEWVADPFDAPNIRPNLTYIITNPNTGEEFLPPNGRCWRTTKEKFEEYLKDNRILYGKTGKSKPQLKRFKFEAEEKGTNPFTIWDDVGTATEGTKELMNIMDGDKKFATPKPERLLQRIIYLASNENDLVLDCFGGSGTTFAVATKMKRRWIGVEIGEHADTIEIPRLKKVLSGEDTGGISESQDWSGGGSFKYYHLGESILDFDKKDFRWSLGTEYIQDSLLSIFDYIYTDEIKISDNALIEDQNKYSIGVLQVKNKVTVGIVCLNKPENIVPLEFEEVSNIYETIKKHYSEKDISLENITIFTNRGVELTEETKPNDLDIIKVPTAIFNEMDN